MKTQGIKTLYRLFAYLSDRTNGFKPFVHYKLMLGALLISLTANACKGKSTPATTDAAPQEPEDIPVVQCYESATPPEEDSVAEKSTTIPTFIPPVITDTVIEEVSCYKIAVPMVTCYELIYIPDSALPSSKNEVYQVVEEMPSFPGGEDSLMRFLNDNLGYPEMTRDFISGKVYVQFIVKSTGEIDDIQIIGSPHELLSKEVIRVISLMPHWIPGKQNGESVDVYYTLPVIFNLEQ